MILLDSDISSFGDYLIFVDESGDHNLGASIDKDFPVFVLMFLVVNKHEYTDKIVPAFQKLKLKYWGHDQVIFHEREIRKKTGYFKLFDQCPSVKHSFYDDLNGVMGTLNYHLFPVLIDKKKHQQKYTAPEHPYHLALEFGMERVHRFLKSKRQVGNKISVVFESRGLKEDKELAVAFTERCSSCVGYVNLYKINYQLVFASKLSNSTGLQMADLTARPYGLNYLKPEQTNQAVDIFKSKIVVSKQFP